MRDTHTHTAIFLEKGDILFSNSELLHQGFWLESMFFFFSFCYTDRFPNTNMRLVLLDLQISSSTFSNLETFHLHHF